MDSAHGERSAIPDVQVLQLTVPESSDWRTMGRVSDKERREVAAKLRKLEPCLFDDGEYIDCGEVEEALGLVNDDGAWYRADGVMRLADLIEPSSDALLETADENAAEYADAETMRDERDYRYQARVGNVVLQGNNGYALLDAMLEMGA